MQSEKQPILFAVGINHKTTAIEAREKIYIQESEIPQLLEKLHETIEECVVLSTCNRTEIYGVTFRTDIDLDFYKDLLIDFKHARGIVKREHFFGLVSCAACQQLFQVATGIDSKVIGDTQILGQMRSAYELAKYHNSTGKILNQLFQRGFKIGKQSRGETNLHKGAVSVSLAAVELAAAEYGSLADKTVMIIGAGKTAEMTAECLMQRHVKKILITNRTKSRAENLLKKLHETYSFDGKVIDFSEYKKHLSETNIVISSTSSPEAILHKEDFAGLTNNMLLIDIAVPRDIAPEVAECENVILKNIDHLNQIIDRNYQRRMADLPLVQNIIRTEMVDFLVWYYSIPLLSVNLPCGAKPDVKTQTEIVDVKTFLLKNVSRLHKMAMQNGAENFAGHVSVINELSSMRKSELQMRANIGA